MGKVYAASFSTPLGSYNVNVGAPIDVRLVVEKYDDLIDSKTFGTSYYIGMPVYAKLEESIYVLTSVPTGTNLQISKNWKTEAIWKKVGGSDVDIEGLGVKIVDNLDSISSPKPGMLAVVSNELYVYANDESSWVKVGGSSDNIDVNGNVPTSGNGITIDKNAKDAFVEELYIDSENEIKGGEYYTSRGLNSSTKNGGDVDVDYITLSKDGESYIKIFGDGDNWIELNIVDDSLGLSMSDIKYIDGDGNEHIMDESPLILPKETPISFANDFSFIGLTEVRPDGSHYVFGEDGCSYDDVDIYSSNVLPNVYAYVNGTPTRILTEGDKEEIINMIDISPIPTDDIMRLFDK